MKKTTQIGICFFLALMVLPGATFAQDDLSRAYKKEFAYLKAQKEALSTRLKQVEAKTKSKASASKLEVDRLQGSLVSLTMSADTMEEQLLDAQRSAITFDDRSDNLSGVLEQANATLVKFDMEVATPEDTPEARAKSIEAVFQNSIQLLKTGGEVRKEAGSFFAPDGRQVNGELIKIGRIATYGVGDGLSGALAPAGDGRLKLWPEDSAAAASALAAGNTPDSMGMFLFENLDKPVEEKKGKTILKTIQAGGVIAWVITIIGLFAILLIVLRGTYLAWVGRDSQGFSDKVVNLVAEQKLKEALKVVGGSTLPTARVLKDTITHLDEDRDVLEDIASESVLREVPKLERFGNIIMVFAAVSPLLGLLGTVTGMIATFDIITEFGTGDPKLLSGGISEALITTQLGLVVAIPALLFGNLLNTRAATVIDGMEHAALRVINAAHTKKPTDPVDAGGTSKVSRPTLKRVRAESAA